MQEDFIQYVWKFGLFNSLDLKTTQGKSLQIIHPGYQNFASGPDFTNAKIKLDNQLWAGNIEIHLGKNDWNLHKHYLDPAYNNVVLHVVFANSNTIVKTENGRSLETLEIQDLIYPETIQNYQNLMFSSKNNFVPCQNLVKPEPSFLLTFYDRLLAERLERKIKDIENDLELCQGDLDKAFLIALFKYFGAPQNKVPFEVLARNLDLSKLIKQAVSKENIEALLFGMAGFLETDIEDDYKIKLENEYAYLKQLYKIDSVLKYSNWKFAGTRPPNFPTIRLAQLSAVLFKEQRWFSYIQSENEIDKIREKLNAAPSKYWKTHYNFETASKETKKQTSDAFLDKIMINVVVPFLFYYGKFVQEEKYTERAFEILLSLKSETNQIIKAWKNIGFPCKSAFDSQALISLKQDYCNEKRCLNCAIGYKILNKKKNE